MHYILNNLYASFWSLFKIIFLLFLGPLRLIMDASLRWHDTRKCHTSIKSVTSILAGKSFLTCKSYLTGMRYEFCKESIECHASVGWHPGPLRIALYSIFIILISIASSSFAENIPPENNQIENILVVGDSLSAGYGIHPEQGWVEMMDKRLHEQKLPYQVVNISTSGDTTSNGLDKIDAALQDYKPKIVIIGLGSNDGLRGLSTQAIKVNLTKLIEKSQIVGAKVILIGFLIPMNYGEKYRRQFEKVFKDLSSQYHLPNVPFLLQNIIDKPGMFLEDGLHPNEKAQPIILNTVWPILKKQL